MLAYLTNVYPSPSHAFIRREIAGVEAAGISVHRFTVRPADQLVDPADIAERDRTTAILSSKSALLGASLSAAVRAPARFLAAFVTALRFGRRSDRGRIKHLAYLAEAAVLLRHCRRRGISHLHAHFGTNSATVAALCRLMGGPTFSFTVHGPEEFDNPLGWSLADKIALASFVVGVSQFGRSQLLRWCPHPRWPDVHVIHCGLDEAFLSASSEAAGASTEFVCVGRLCEQKGQLLLLEAAAQLKADGRAFHVTFIGDGEMRPEIEALIAATGLSGNVTLLGWQSGEQIRQRLLGCRAMVLPSLAEGLPVALMEAMGLGKPVITTAIAGIPELVQNSHNGWLIPAGNATALAHAMADCLNATPERLGHLGRFAARSVAANHTASKEAARLAALFTHYLPAVPAAQPARRTPEAVIIP